MRITSFKAALAAAAAGGLAAAGLGAAPALATTVVTVPCGVGHLSSAISTAVSGEVLQLSPSCAYVLHTALPQVKVPLTLEGHSTIARSTLLLTPHFSLLTVGSGGALTTDDIDFVNGYATTYGGAINGASGPVTVHGGTFTGNNSGTYGGAIYNGDGLTVIGATFTGNSSRNYGGVIYNDDPALITGSHLH